jgi:hypothetical protein
MSLDLMSVKVLPAGTGQRMAPGRILIKTRKSMALALLWELRREIVRRITNHPPAPFPWDEGGSAL